MCCRHANLSLILTHTAVALATRDAFGTQEAQTETTFLLPELVRSFFSSYYTTPNQLKEGTFQELEDLLITLN